MVAPWARSAGNASANVCRIERADARSASARGDPINAVIHGYRISCLNDWLTGRPRIHALDGGLPRHAGQDRLTREPRVSRANSTAGCGVASGCDEEKTGAPPAAGRCTGWRAPQRVVGGRVGRVIEAQLLQQRDVDGVRVGMEELRAEVDGDTPPSVLDHVRIAVTADLRSRLEQVDVVGAGHEVGRGHAARTGADDGDAFSACAPRPAAAVLAGEAAPQRHHDPPAPTRRRPSPIRPRA